MYDCIVIGGGPSGLMAAISASEFGNSTLLIDKGDKLGRKLAISGGGRCNVTNRLPIDEIIKHIPGNGRFLYSALSEFSNEDIISYFQNLGIKLKEEDHGRMFPESDKAQTVVDVLVEQLKKQNVKVMVNKPVKDIIIENNQVVGVVTKDNKKILSKAVIIASGGCSVPHTGSTGDGYIWAQYAGHTITELYPTEVPLTSKEPFIKNKSLQGLSLKNVAVSVINPKGKAIITHQMDMIFTHFGLSGPAILRCSQYVVKALKKFNVQEITIQIDSFPDRNIEQLKNQITKILRENPKKDIKNALKGFLPERYLLFLLDFCDIHVNSSTSQISADQILKLTEATKKFPVKVNGTLPLDKAFVTGGGVSVKEIDPKTMASKKTKGLYFCGEILDVHGYTGGFNITAALVTGRIAGKNAANTQ